MGSIFQKNNFFNDITYWKNNEQVWDYSVGDELKIIAEGVNATYKSAFTGIGFLASDGVTELTYTATSEGWDSEEPSNYVMTFTVPDTFSGNIYITTKFNTTGMYDIDFNVTYDADLVNPDYCSFAIRNNAMKKALPNTIVDLRVEAYVLDSSIQLSFDEFTTLTGISASAFTAWKLVQNYSNYRIFECSFTMPSNNVAMTANFKEGSAPTVTHTVIFRANNQIIGIVNVADGSAIPSEAIPTVPSSMIPEGKEFDYWAENGVEFDFSTLITATTELNAVFKDIPAPEPCTVTFKEGDAIIAEVEVAYNTTVKDRYPDHMTDASGKEFVYWLDENNEKFDFKTPITENITLTAYYVQAGSSKWIMSLPNCYVGLKSDVADLPKARVADGTKALALSATAGEETAYMFNKATLTWIELQHYSVRI